MAGRTSRRGFLDRVAKLLFAAGGASLAGGALGAQSADAYHLCGHTYTTGSCPHPTGRPRVDARGLPLRARDGMPVDDLGRPVDGNGQPVDQQGHPLSDPDGRPLPNAPRTALCHAAGERYGIGTRVDGAWFRCCGGHVRKLMDCCSYKPTRINGDSASTGYCYRGRKVFCVHYYQTKVPC